jgi:hypothetical protein
LFHSSISQSTDGNMEDSQAQRKLFTGDRDESKFDGLNDEDDDDESDYDEDDDFAFYGEKSGPNSQQQNDHFTSEELFRKFVNKIKVEKYEGVENLPSGAGNKIITASKKITANR